jgi:hypothetical protein
VDLRLLGSVLRRFYVLVVAGLILAVGLSVLSMAKVTGNGLAYRQHEVWSSSSILFLTQKGFPWGRVVRENSSGYPALAGLTNLYAEFANSDGVKRTLRRKGAPESWKITAAPVEAANPYSGSPPLISLTATAFTAADAVKAASLGSSVFAAYVKANQDAAKIPPDQRLRIQVLQRGTKPVVVQPRKKTVPIMVFLAVLTLTVTLALALENLRPRSAIEPVISVSAAEPTVASRAGWKHTA